MAIRHGDWLHLCVQRQYTSEFHLLGTSKVRDDCSLHPVFTCVASGEHLVARE